MRFGAAHSEQNGFSSEILYIVSRFAIRYFLSKKI
jgi:hypothetical protein